MSLIMPAKPRVTNLRYIIYQLSFYTLNVMKVMPRADLVILRAGLVMLRASRVTLRASRVTLRANL